MPPCSFFFVLEVVTAVVQLVEYHADVGCHRDEHGHHERELQELESRVAVDEGEHEAGKIQTDKDYDGGYGEYSFFHVGVLLFMINSRRKNMRVHFTAGIICYVYILLLRCTKRNVLRTLNNL